MMIKNSESIFSQVLVSIILHISENLHWFWPNTSQKSITRGFLDANHCRYVLCNNQSALTHGNGACINYRVWIILQFLSKLLTRMVKSSSFHKYWGVILILTTVLWMKAINLTTSFYYNVFHLLLLKLLHYFVIITDKTKNRTKKSVCAI